MKDLMVHIDERLSERFDSTVRDSKQVIYSDEITGPKEDFRIIQCC